LQLTEYQTKKPQRTEMKLQMALEYLYFSVILATLHVIANSEDLSTICKNKDNTDSDLGILCNKLFKDSNPEESKTRNRRSGGSYVRFGRSAESGRNYVRFGRATNDKKSDYVRFGRSAEKNSNLASDYLKSFGSVDEQNNRIARSSEPSLERHLSNDDNVDELSKRYIRYGKRNEIESELEAIKRYMRYGKRLSDDEDVEKRFMRIINGKRYMRYGRGDDEEDEEPSMYNKRYMRYGRPDDSFSTEEKRYIRYGRDTTGTNSS